MSGNATLWRQSVSASTEGKNAADQIREAFDARWVLVEKDRVRQGLYAQALVCPKLRLRYDDVEAAVFSVEPGRCPQTPSAPRAKPKGNKNTISSMGKGSRRDSIKRP